MSAKSSNPPWYHPELTPQSYASYENFAENSATTEIAAQRTAKWIRYMTMRDLRKFTKSTQSVYLESELPHYFRRDETADRFFWNGKYSLKQQLPYEPLEALRRVARGFLANCTHIIR